MLLNRKFLRSVVFCAMAVSMAIAACGRVDEIRPGKTRVTFSGANNSGSDRMNMNAIPNLSQGYGVFVRGPSRDNIGVPPSAPNPPVLDLLNGGYHFFAVGFDASDTAPKCDHVEAGLSGNPIVINMNLNSAKCSDAPFAMKYFRIHTCSTFSGMDGSGCPGLGSSCQCTAGTGGAFTSGEVDFIPGLKKTASISSGKTTQFYKVPVGSMFGIGVSGVRSGFRRDVFFPNGFPPGITVEAGQYVLVHTLASIDVFLLEGI